MRYTVKAYNANTYTVMVFNSLWASHYYADEFVSGRYGKGWTNAEIVDTTTGEIVYETKRA